jgi:hypothetical protein
MAVTRTGQGDNTPRRCFYIPPDAYVEGRGFVPSMVTENEPGHAPLGGSGEYSQPWYWGADYVTATAIADTENRRLGLTPEDVAAIVISSMALMNEGESS